MTLTAARFLAIARVEGVSSIEAIQCWPRVQREMLEGKVRLLQDVSPALQQDALDEFDHELVRVIRRVLRHVIARRQN